jgi:hypothetical protein
MTLKRGLLLIAILVGFAAQEAAAQTKIAIYVDGAGTDTVGTTFLYQLREQLKASQSYRLVDDEEDAAFHVGVVSLDPDHTRNASVRTIVSISLSIETSWEHDYLVTHWVVLAGADMVNSSVTDVIAAVDKHIQPIVASMRRKGSNDAQGRRTSLESAPLPHSLESDQ